MLAPLQAVAHPSLQSGAPFTSHGGQVKCDSWMWGCTADQAAGTSTWKTCQKDFISSSNLERKSFLDFYLRCDTLCSCLCWLEMCSAPECSQLGETSGELGCRESFITPPTPAGCQVRETQPEHEQLFLTDVARSALKQ